MQKGYRQPLGPAARRLVDKAYAFAFCLGKRLLDVFHRIRHMMHSLAPVGNKLGDGALLARRFEQFYLGLADFEKCSLHLLVGNFLNTVTLETQNVFPERYRLFQTLHGDSEMFDMRNFHLFDIFGLTELTRLSAVGKSQTLQR